MRSHRYSDVEPLRDPDTGQWNTDEIKRRAKGWAAVLLALAVLGAGGALVAAKGYEFYMGAKTAKDYVGAGTGETQVVIPKSSTALQIGKILADGGVIKDAKKFQDTALTRPDLWGKVQAGKFKLAKEVPSLTALQQLVDPTRAIHNWMSVPEGWRIDPQLVDVLAKGMKLPAPDVKAFLTTKARPNDYGYPAWVSPTGAAGPVAFEGLLFPDKYDVQDGATLEAQTKAIAGNFNAVMARLDFKTKAQALSFGDPKDTENTKAYKALIVASIIEKEVFRAEDRAKVARVIYNRLAKGVQLQFDSTVAYSVNKTGTVWTTADERDCKKNPSPYNTYCVKGLPPTPISAPAEAALSAALNPEAGDWMFFVPINLDTGETKFSVTDAEHNAARAELQAWCLASPENKKKCA
ncbi:endolytic transglycosylase MltG [Propioniciclava tarda]|uniref:Endolytic murein transglycosylase n=1 Tax=Propioniciclava tarda TaxID=433330 RepID=A0A4Q9KN44_PROTD|nr:endolytic transglycosylase MltG [Propioniciclava tarda]SMO40722.1 UPF0755 protein [Propioniciclava tarda]